MPSKTVHYQHPKFSTGYNACGLGDRLTIQLTSDPSQITCKACLKTATGQETTKRSPGRPLNGNSPKEQVTTRIDRTLKQQAKDAKLNLAELLENAIRQKLSA